MINNAGLFAEPSLIICTKCTNNSDHTVELWNLSENHDGPKMLYIYIYSIYYYYFFNKKQTYSAKIINLICENEAFTAFMYMTIIIMLLFNNKIW